MKVFLFLALCLSIASAQFDSKGIYKTDCQTCLKTPSTKFCIPYESWSGLPSGKAQGWCCDIRSNKTACASTSEYFCSDWLETDADNNYLDEYLYNAFCSFDQDSCFSGRGETFDQRGVQVETGRVIPIGEHAVMQAGTTGNFGSKTNCTWHLMSLTPYKGVENLWIKISQSLSGVAGKQAPDSTVKMYIGDSFADIIKTKTNKGLTLDTKSQEFTVGTDKHVIIVAVGGQDVGFVNIQYKLVEKYKLWYYPIAFGLFVMLLSICTGVFIYFPLNRIVAAAIKEHNFKWAKGANDRMVDMKTAVADHEKYLTTGVLPASAITKTPAGARGAASGGGAASKNQSVPAANGYGRRGTLGRHGALNQVGLDNQIQRQNTQMMNQMNQMMMQKMMVDMLKK